MDEPSRPGETQRHGTLWTMKQWKRLAHCMLYVRCVALFDTLAREFLMWSHGTTRGHPACIAATGATRDEEQEEQCGETSGVPVGAWQSLTERQGNPVEPSAIQKGGKRGDVLRTMRDLRELVAVHSPDHGGAGFEDDAKQSHSALVNKETTGRDRTRHSRVSTGNA